jgi:hypothetical protein
LSQDPNLQDSNLFLPVILPATSALLAFINNALAHHFGTAEKPMTAEEVRKIVREELAHTR